VLGLPGQDQGRSSEGGLLADAGDITGLLLEWNAGSGEAPAKLVALVYRELRRRAGRALSGERPDLTLEPTGLVHETYQRLIDQRRVQWRNRAHFFAVAAVLMRRILVDHSRRHAALRRGGRARTVSLDDVSAASPQPDRVEVLAVDEALTQLAALDPDQARIVELRYFGGMGVEETAEVMGISRATVQRDWAMARAWLRQRLDGGGGPP
jgi:RNA polymerase sigma factor (TIGR02999 family)